MSRLETNLTPWGEQKENALQGGCNAQQWAIKAVFWLVLVLLPGNGFPAQDPQLVRHPKSLHSSAPVFAQATNATNLSAATSITSPAITVTAGDFVYVECVFPAGTGTLTVTSSPSNTWNLLSQSGAAIGDMQPSYALNVAGGSTTFTCTSASSAANQQMIVLDYHQGFLTTLDTQTSQLGSAFGTNVVTVPFTTTAKGLIIVCAHDDSFSATWSGGLIGAATGTVRQTILTGACEDTIPNASQGPISGALTLSSSANYIVHAKAFK